MNGERIRRLLERLRNSLWFVPTLMTVLSAILATVTVSVDRSIGGGLAGTRLVFDAGTEGARGVLGTIAGSIITVTGVVFSVTIVALQLASSQFTPRVLRSFLDDRAVQVVFGIFIASFTFSLLVLRTVRSSLEDVESFVPALSVTVAVAMALVSIGALIFFINHITRSMQVETILARVAADITNRIDVLFPDDLGKPATPAGQGWQAPAAEAFALRSPIAGYLQNIDETEIMRRVEENDLILTMDVGVGDFVLEGDTLARVWPEDTGRRCAADILGTIQLGNERTLFQDVQRGIIELTDIAVRALSPGVNDPTTALSCIDRLTQVLRVMGRRRFPDAIRLGKDGRPRVIAVTRPFAEIVGFPYRQLRHYGGGQPVIALALVASLGRVARGLPSDRVQPLRDELEELLRTARREIASSADLDRVEQAAWQANRDFDMAEGSDESALAEQAQAQR